MTLIQRLRLTVLVALIASGRPALGQGSGALGDPVYSLVAAVGGYHPVETPSGIDARIAAGVRASFPEWYDGRDVALQLEGSHWASPSESISGAELEVLLFPAGFSFLPFQNRLIFGAGVGDLVVTQSGVDTVHAPSISVSGGLQTYVGNCVLESRVKLILTHHNPTFDASGPCLEVSASYPIGF